ncbi:hypothetical protein GGI15_002725 [Coemansia interrupta]|uniref:SCP domain-containing protein n=1 Tax=Coemansia interrupta TaxID=1126814 RepID=A0A9W8HK03_9FUNG|nr:hypothetical protein GGI15_002725 [Coemansia interrupta]
MRIATIIALVAAHCIAAVTPDPPSDDWRAEMLVLVNSVRAAASQPPLKLDDQANVMAQRHSEYQASMDRMTHDDALGSLGDRATRLDIRWSALAENVAVGSQTVKDTMAMWIASPHHYANIVGQYSLVGFGRAASNMTDSRESIYWTQDFIQPQA